MDDFPDQVAWDILSRLKTTSDRNSVSLTCKRLHRLENEQRKSIRVGCGLHPANRALPSLCSRFRNLETVEICYSGWMSRLGNQLDDKGLHTLSTACPSLKNLTLSYCTFITDSGLTHLASCSRLSSLKLIFAPRISGVGILSAVVGCKNLTVLSLTRCLNINTTEWLEYLGKLEDLCIKNCRGIGEGDLVKLGDTWRRLKRLHFEVDPTHRYTKVYDRLSVERWQNQRVVPCDSMIELKLVNGVNTPGRGLARVLGECKNMERVWLEMCVGVKDSDVIKLAEKSSNLRSISITMPSDFSMPLLTSNQFTLTDECLEGLGLHCRKLESVRLSFSDGEFPTYSSFTLGGILDLVRRCPIRELALDRVCSFNDVGMEALCSAECLEILEVSRCQDITDEGLRLVREFPKLSVLKVSKCLGMTDEGLKPLIGSSKLEVLAVDDCPMISEMGTRGAAHSVTFKQDFSWMY